MGESILNGFRIGFMPQEMLMALGVKTPEVRKVIINPPATIVLWEDGTRTVVKCDERDVYDPMHGYVLCWLKKLLGNSSRKLNDALRERQGKIEWQCDRAHFLYAEPTMEGVNNYHDNQEQKKSK